MAERDGASDRLLACVVAMPPWPPRLIVRRSATLNSVSGAAATVAKAVPDESVTSADIAPCATVSDVATDVSASCRAVICGSSCDGVLP